MALIDAAMRPPRFDFRKPPSATVVFASLAVAATLGGLFLVIQIAVTTTPLVGLNTEARGDTLSMWVSDSQVLDHVHSEDDDEQEDQGSFTALNDLTAQGDTDAEGFAMPASMMPGTPDEGFRRFQLELDLRNWSSVTTTVAPLDFYLESVDGERWNPLIGGTLHRTDLESQQGLSTVVAFDIPERVETSDVHLVWMGDGEEIHFAVDPDGGHNHG